MVSNKRLVSRTAAENPENSYLKKSEFEPKFPNFQTLIGFFSTFFEQTQITRKLRTSKYCELQVCKVSEKSEGSGFRLSYWA